LCSGAQFKVAIFYGLLTLLLRLVLLLAVSFLFSSITRSLATAFARAFSSELAHDISGSSVFETKYQLFLFVQMARCSSSGGYDSDRFGSTIADPLS
jgi:uncharacterized protein involved in cysteine biosynthesis